MSEAKKRKLDDQDVNGSPIPTITVDDEESLSEGLSGESTGAEASKITKLNYKNYCELCLQYWPDDGRISELMEKNPKKVKHVQVILSYLTGVDVTKEEEMVRDCAKKGVPIMENLPQLCPLCYQTLAGIEGLHKDLLRAQRVLQKQTLKARLIVIKTRVKEPGELSSASEKFENGLKFCGMTDKEMKSARGFVDNLHNIIINEGTTGLTFPSTLPEKLVDPKWTLLPISSTYQPPATPSTTGILIPVKIVTTAATSEAANSSSSGGGMTASVKALSDKRFLITSVTTGSDNTQTTSIHTSPVSFTKTSKDIVTVTKQPQTNINEKLPQSVSAISSSLPKPSTLISESEAVHLPPPVSVKTFCDEDDYESETESVGKDPFLDGEVKEETQEMDMEGNQELEQNQEGSAPERMEVKVEPLFILPDSDDDDDVNDNNSTANKASIPRIQHRPITPPILVLVPNNAPPQPDPSPPLAPTATTSKPKAKRKKKPVLQPCDICSNKLNVGDMFKHMESHVGAYARKCLNPKCNQTYATIFRMENHLRKASKCRETTNLPKTSRAQIRMCNACGFQTNIYKRFARHILQHEEKTLQKSFACPISNCEETFGLRLSVEIHLESHCTYPL